MDRVNFRRTLSLANGDSVEIVIGAPVRDSDDSDWACSCQILGLGDEKIREVYGVDAIQAILLSLKRVATTLYFSDEFRNGEISWMGGSELGDLGLPIPETVRDQISEMRESLK